MSRTHLTALLAAIALLVSSSTASAIYLRPELEKVPVERLTENLTKAVEKNPKDVNALLNLARVHAMAYSLRSDTVEVNKRTPGRVWFGFEPPLVPFNKVTKVEDKEKLQEAKKHLEKALELYRKAFTMKPDDLKIHLGLAWLLSHTDDKDKAVKELRAVAEKGWEKEKNLRALGLGGHTVTKEAAGYLVPLLDPKQDAKEIATLKERAEMLAKLPRPITPIAVPLRAGLTARDLEDRSANVRFDADGSGIRKSWTWVNKDAAWLVHDPKQSGRVTSGLQLFGNVTFWLFWETGYDALGVLDDDHDGRLRGSELTGLALWHDANGNGVSDPGEVEPLAAHGIVGLSCSSDRDESHPDRIAFSKAGVTFADGSTRPTFDLVLHPAK